MKKNIFYADLSKIYERAKAKPISCVQLSLNIGKCRSWLSSLKNKRRKREQNLVIIRMEDARAIARELGCNVQDIQNEEAERHVIEPMLFDYNSKAKDIFRNLMDDDAELTEEILQMLAEIPKEQRKEVLPVLRMAQNKANRERSDESWWRVLFYVELGRVLLTSIDCCTVEQLRKECENLYEIRKRQIEVYSKKERESAKKTVTAKGYTGEKFEEELRKELALRYFDKDKRQKIIGERLVKKTQTWLEGLPVGTKKDYENAIARCAEALDCFFMGLDDKTMQAVVEFYKKGVWYFSWLGEDTNMRAVFPDKH